MAFSAYSQKMEWKNISGVGQMDAMGSTATLNRDSVVFDYIKVEISDDTAFVSLSFVIYRKKYEVDCFGIRRFRGLEKIDEIKVENERFGIECNDEYRQRFIRRNNRYFDFDEVYVTKGKLDIHIGEKRYIIQGLKLWNI